jgi:hypothetical protein
LRFIGTAHRDKVRVKKRLFDRIYRIARIVCPIVFPGNRNPENPENPV